MCVFFNLKNAPVSPSTPVTPSSHLPPFIYYLLLLLLLFYLCVCARVCVCTAIAQMNNRDIDGRTIFVREDNKYSSGGGGAPPPQQHYAPRGPAPGMGMSGERNPGNPNGTKVFVGNLSWATRWQGLKDHMRQAGNVLHADIMMESGGRSKGCAIVEYATPEEAANAIATLADTNLDGRPIFVREDRRGRP